MKIQLCNHSIILVLCVVVFPASVNSQTGSTATGDYKAGKLFRPLEMFPWLSAPESQHVDAIVRAGTSYTKRGFFAVSMLAAVIGADAWMNYPSWLPERNDIGWVEGVISNQGPWGREVSIVVDQAKYLTIRGNILNSTCNRYHLVRFNCQDWAAQQVVP